MPSLNECLVQIYRTPLGDILTTLGQLASGQQDGGEQGGGQQLPPPMAAGVVSDAIGQAFIESGNGDLVTQGTSPDGSTFNSIGPDLLNPALRLLWTLGWPAAYREDDGSDYVGAPVFFSPPANIMRSATLCALAVAGRTSEQADLGQICVAKLNSLGYGSFPA